jgi:competence protein ComEC
LVLRLDFKQFNILFTGDIEIEQEHSLSKNKQTFIEVMKVPHHGSETSSSEIFLEKFLPDIAVFSYGKSNKFGHPSVSVVKRYQNLAVIDYHIAREGAVIIKTNGQNYTVHTYSSHRKDKYICNN